jgi:hypothetical protein
VVGASGGGAPTDSGLPFAWADVVQEFESIVGESARRVGRSEAWLELGGEFPEDQCRVGVRQLEGGGKGREGNDSGFGSKGDQEENEQGLEVLVFAGGIRGIELMREFFEGRLFFPEETAVLYQVLLGKPQHADTARFRVRCSRGRGEGVWGVRLIFLPPGVRRVKWLAVRSGFFEGNGARILFQNPELACGFGVCSLYFREPICWCGVGFSGS